MYAAGFRMADVETPFSVLAIELKRPLLFSELLLVVSYNSPVQVTIVLAGSETVTHPFRPAEVANSFGAVVEPPLLLGIFSISTAKDRDGEGTNATVIVHATWNVVDNQDRRSSRDGKFTSRLERISGDHHALTEVIHNITMYNRTNGNRGKTSPRLDIVLVCIIIEYELCLDALISIIVPEEDFDHFNGK
jgi:hypothetical protein